MSINILETLDNLVSSDTKFRGAIFVTYSLNLQFFEQLVQPKLDALGCAHVVIISDQFGYRETITRNLHQLGGVGRQYICAPVHSNGRGVQHSKLLMLVSEDRGWMLVGSGNLTFQGYGQNLELFDLFELDRPNQESGAIYPFQSAWRLIEKFIPILPKTAQDHLGKLQNSVTWLGGVSSSHDGTAFWNSFDQPLFEEIAKLDRVNELQLIAPFIDTLSVQRLINHFSPKKVTIGVNSLSPNIDGKTLAELCRTHECKLELRALYAVKSQAKRGLHAKAIIGIHGYGSWCIAGSANITRPALLDHWKAQGNIETVVFRTALDPRAFDILWRGNIVESKSLSIRDAVVSIEEPQNKSEQEIIRLFDIVVRGREIQGKVSFRKTLEVEELSLHLVLSNEQYSISLDNDHRFSAHLKTPLSHPEAAEVMVSYSDGNIYHSDVVFIDQVQELDHYAARSYHQSIYSKMETVSGAAFTFKELMEFLFQRTDRAVLAKESLIHRKRTERSHTEAAADSYTEHEVLPASAFTTDEELNAHIGRRIHSLEPYDRDHYSLRELLSLALLRLTTETTPLRILDASVDNREDETSMTEEIEEQLQIQRTWQEWLVKYLTSYCKRYNERLRDRHFVQETGSNLLLQNQHTLTRVLLEFRRKTEVLTSSMLRIAVRQLWEPFFEIDGVLTTLDSNELYQLWTGEALTEALVKMIASAWSDPIPKWGSYQDAALLSRFMYAKLLIGKAERFLGNRFWTSISISEVSQASLHEQNGAIDYSFGLESVPANAMRHFEDLANFRTPIERHFEPCIRLMQLRKSGRGQSSEAQTIAAELLEHEPKTWQLVHIASRIEPVIGDQIECPISYIELPEHHLMQLRRGELILSPHTPGLLLYWLPKFDENNVEL